MKIRIVIIGLLVFFGTLNAFCQKPITILFVCEHGSAKSIVAAAHFKKLAEDEGLNVKVVSRGINPDSVIPEAINKHLESDGFQRQNDSPVQLSNSDLKNSDYVVAFNPIPEKYTQKGSIENWNVPPISAGYTTAKDSILVNIRRIIVKIKSDTKK